MTTSTQFPFLGDHKRKYDYLTEIMLHGQIVIPSDTFELENNEFIILDLLIGESEPIIKILGIKGQLMGNIYSVPESIFDIISITNITRYQVR